MQRYRMPAEWEPHAAIWLAWPDNKDTWPENLVAAQLEFTALAHSLAEFVPVHVMVNESSLGVAKRNLIRPDTANVFLIDIATNDAWVRDYGPTFVIDQEMQLVALNWHYNAWGGKYPPFDLDQVVGKKIADGQGLQCLDPELCFEGGAVETNGQGIVLSTRSCAGDENRNADVSAEQRLAAFEAAFEKYLGANSTVWLPGNAVAGDDTDGHIDQLARFVNETTVVYAWSKESDPQHEALRANLVTLKQGLENLGEFKLFPLMIPEPINAFGRRLPASYCNFLITNELVIVPQFGVPEDAAAVETIKSFFDERYVIGLPSRNISVGLGSFHCLSQQVPRC